MRLLLLLLMSLTLVACGEPPVIRQKQVVDGLSIFIEHPERVQINREVDLVVTLVDSDDRTINGAIVALDLTMPEMPMGQNQPLADPLGGGRYRARATFGMEGAWVARVKVALGEREYLATFEQMVIP